MDKEVRLPVFCERFRELVGSVTQNEFADMVGLSRATVGFYHHGDRIPDAAVLLKIADKCNISVDWLLGISDAKTRDTTVQSVSAYTGLSENVIEALHNEKNADRNEMQDVIEYLMAYHQKQV